jgi:MFS family permease
MGVNETPHKRSAGMAEHQQYAGMRLVYCGQAFGAVLTQLLSASAVGVLFIKHLGGSDFQAMLLVSLFSLPRILQVPVSLLVRPSRGKHFMLTCWMLNGVAVGVAIAATFLPVAPPIKVFLVLLFISTGALLQMSGLTFWFPLLHDVVPSRMRGRFFGRMRTIWGATSFAAIVLTGLFLGSDPQPWRFQVVLGIALGLYLARNLFIARVPEPQTHADDNYSNWKEYVRQILSRREVVVFCVYFSLLTFAAGFLNTPLVLYMRHMGFAVRDNVIVFSFNVLGRLLSLFIAGVLADRIGTRRVFLMAHVGLCAVCVAVVGIGFLPAGPARCVMPIAMTFAGAMLAMAGIACSAQLFHLAPDHGRAFFMSLALILITCGAALSPILAGYIYEHASERLTVALHGVIFNPFQVMLSIAAVTMIVLLVFLGFIKDVRRPSSSDDVSESS